jgi:MFS family permease
VHRPVLIEYDGDWFGGQITRVAETGVHARFDCDGSVCFVPADGFESRIKQEEEDDASPSPLSTREACGTTFLLVVAFVYFAQGFRSFGQLGVTFFLKDHMRLPAPAMQSLLATASLPWSFKPLYGILSDSYPIMGEHRRPYIALAGVLGVCGWLCLATLAAASLSAHAGQAGGAGGAGEAAAAVGTADTTLLLTVLVVCSLSTALSDVIIDAMVAQKSREMAKRCPGLEDSLQSICWGAMAVGGLAGSALGATYATKIGAASVFALNAVCPAGVLVASTFLAQEHPEVKTGTKEKKTTPPAAAQKHVGKGSWAIVRSARELVLAIADPRVCRPLLYVFLTTALAPSLSVPLLIFITSPRDAQPAGLGFTMEFLAGTQSVMWVAMLAASALYSRFLAGTGHRKVFFWSQVLSHAL